MQSEHSKRLSAFTQTDGDFRDELTDFSTWAQTEDFDDDTKKFRVESSNDPIRSNNDFTVIAE